MWPDNLGLMLYNGLDGLIYYSKKAGRVFVSNGGIIATVGVSSYLFPGTVVAGIGGAIAIRGATWLTREVDNRYHIHIADLLNKLLTVLPPSFSRAYGELAYQISRPQRRVSNAVDPSNARDSPLLNWVNESLATELMSPVLEEGIYRFGLQQGLHFGLARLGVPNGIASFLAGAIASHLFAGGHEPDPAHPMFRETLTAGIGFGIMMYSHGLPAAIVAHGANNACVRLERALTP